MSVCVLHINIGGVVEEVLFSFHTPSPNANAIRPVGSPNANVVLRSELQNALNSKKVSSQSLRSRRKHSINNFLSISQLILYSSSGNFASGLLRKIS